MRQEKNGKSAAESAAELVDEGKEYIDQKKDWPAYAASRRTRNGKPF